MVDFLLALLVAGHETTPTIMTIVVKFLTENPSALALVKEEQEEIRARKKDECEALEWSDYKSMSFTQCVINETLRVSNIISGVFRRAVADVHFKDYTIPKGCKVFASFRAVHLDEHYFEEARTFNPWRWMNHTNNITKDGGQQAGGSIFTPPSAAASGCVQATSSAGWRYRFSSITLSPASVGKWRRRTSWSSSPPPGCEMATPSMCGAIDVSDRSITGGCFLMCVVSLHAELNVVMNSLVDDPCFRMSYVECPET
ncbi:hypothetical protein HPP92_019884 [Vanilla planifolia]|uniref:Cytochrome P450 90A1 n=1 Tax=Vanilla planifolia TaxID=51239 RepID=A0A835Q417_VANPL|nr:hypothetical protein HPP92_019884 [Vanilla planifolia]